MVIKCIKRRVIVKQIKMIFCPLWREKEFLVKIIVTVFYAIRMAGYNLFFCVPVFIRHNFHRFALNTAPCDSEFDNDVGICAVAIEKVKQHGNIFFIL